MKTLLSRLSRTPERNVGRGDFVTRLVASLLLAGLLVLLLPSLDVDYPLQKIALLVSAELGLVSLMLALFLATKTYYAGLQLLAVPLLMLGLVRAHLAPVALALGLAFLIAGLASLVTRRCYLNAALNMSSLEEVIEKVTAPEPEKSAPH